MAAARAGLTGRLPAPNLDHLLAPHAGDVLQDEHELGETQVAYLPAPQLLHAAQIQVFKSQHVIVVAKPVGEFEVRITPLVGDSVMGKSQLTLRFLPVAGAFLLAG